MPGGKRICLGGSEIAAYEAPVMTRPAIERCIWVFIIALVCTFLWTVTRVLAMIGWF